MTSCPRAALTYALNLGLPCFPCREDKSPACPHGFKDAALRESGLAALWKRHPGELIGVPTGELSGLNVLDIDRQHGGGDWYMKVKAELPPTRIHRTRSGGLHLFFKHRRGLRSSAGRIAPGIDVRADGGYIVWWPAAGLEIQDRSIAKWPDWLLELLLERPIEAPQPPTTFSRPVTDRRVVAQLAGLARTVDGAVEGQRNSTLFWAANRAAELAREGRIAPGAARELMHSLGARCGLPVTEVRRTIASAFRGSP
jgi:hypothetical protein